MRWAVALVLLLGTAAPGFAQQDFAEAYDAAVADPDGGLDSFLYQIPKVALTFGPADEVYLLEGDIVANRRDVFRYLIQQGGQGMPAAGSTPELRVHAAAGRLAKWGKPERILRYAIARSTFPDGPSYAQVVEEMRAAAGDWEAICPPCGINFVHVAQHDQVKSWDEFAALAANDELRFLVVFQKVPLPVIASAFFPTDPWQRRIVNVFPAYLTLEDSGYSGRGVLRHELGHVLGYRHEHTNLPGCRSEADDWVPVTPYDPHSVMHYFCGGAGTRHLEFSEVDRLGHTSNYSD